MTNLESVPALIQRVFPSCHCASAEVQLPLTIPPGEEILVPLNVDLTDHLPEATADAFGLALDFVVIVDGHTQSLLSIPLSAQVEPGFRVFPRQVAVQRSGGTFRRGEFLIVPEAPTAELLAAADSDAVQLSVAREADEYIVAIEPKESSRIAPSTFHVRLTARLSNGRELGLPNVTVVLRGAVDFHPRVLRFGTIGIGERAQETLNFACGAKERFRVTEVEFPESDPIQVEFDSDAFSNRHAVNVVVEPHSLNEVESRLQVQVELESSAQEIIEIPVSAKAVRREAVNGLNSRGD